MKYSNVEIAKEITISYFENKASKDQLNFEGFQEVMALKFDENNEVLLEHIKTIKNIMENAIKELESKGE